MRPAGPAEGRSRRSPRAWATEGRELKHLRPPLPRPRGFSFWLGVVLIALSFAIYPAYPVVPFLPISRWAQGGAAVGMSVLSWGMFIAGSLLAGKKGVAYLKQRTSEWKERQGDRTDRLRLLFRRTRK
jgi:hypothetical protein